LLDNSLGEIGGPCICREFDGIVAAIRGEYYTEEGYYEEIQNFIRIRLNGLNESFIK
jgi:hypothetical protein